MTSSSPWTFEGFSKNAFREVAELSCLSPFYCPLSSFWIVFLITTTTIIIIIIITIITTTKITIIITIIIDY